MNVAQWFVMTYAYESESPPRWQFVRKNVRPL